MPQWTPNSEQLKKKNQESEKTTYRMGENIYKSNKGLTFAVFKLYIDIC
jgi:hypothetical protein